MEKRINGEAIRSDAERIGTPGTTQRDEGIVDEQIAILRTSAAFDAEWYLSVNPDVRAAGVDPADHYIRWGAAEGRLPTQDFDCDWYLAKYSDAKNSNLLPFVHYAAIGHLEGRSTNERTALLSSAALRFHSGAPIALPRLAQQPIPTPSARIAVVVHIFYPDTWSEIKQAIGNISEQFDLYVSLVAKYSDGIRGLILFEYPNANIYVYDHNRGRDMLPLLHLLHSGILFRYELICKLHSKRSSYVADGNAWRRELIGGILGGRDLVKRIIFNFRARSDIGIVVADGNIFQGFEFWCGNAKYLPVLLMRAGMTVDYANSSFPGGSIFWIRPAILAILRGINIDINDFEPEPLPNDGTLAHAVERLIGCICENVGLRVLSASELEDQVAPAVVS